MLLRRDNLDIQTRLNVIFTFALKIGSALSGIAIGAIVAHLLSMEMVGAYFVILHFFRVASNIIRLGVSTNLMRLLAIFTDRSDWQVAAELLLKAFGLMTAAYMLFAGICYFSWDFIVVGLNLKATELLYWIMMAGVGVRVLEETISNVLRGLHRVKLGVSLLDSPRQLISLIALGLIWACGVALTLKTALYIYVLASLPAIITGAICITPMISRHIRRGEYSKDPFPLLASSLPYWGLNTLSILLVSAPLWLVSALVGDSQAGLYGVAMQLTISISFFLGVTNQVTPATMAALYSSGEHEKLENILRKTASWGLFLSTPALVFLIAFGRPILSMVYGDQYSEAYLVLVLLSISQYVNAVVGSPGMLMQMSGHHQVLLKITVFWVIINLSLGGLLSGIGMNGIAAATCLALIGQNVSMVVFVRRIIGVRTYAKFGLPDINPLRSQLSRFVSLDRLIR